MKITLITVTYNSAQFLQSAIQSVAHQDYSNIEYIIVDGGSTDDTLQIIAKNSATITKWVSEKDEGMYDAINKGMQMATGDVIGILNSDDMLASPNVLSKIAACFEESQADSLFGDLLYVDADETSRIHRSWKGMPYRRSLFRTGWMPAHPTFYVRKSVVDELGGYKPYYFSASDFELMTRYLYKHRVSSCYLPELLVKMRKGGMSNGSFKKRIRANRRDYLALKQNQVPFALLVSMIKPLRKLPQYIGFLHQSKTEKEPAMELSPAIA